MKTREPIRIEQEPQRLSDAVFQALRKAILDGKLAPGEWLRQEALARELGVSQITVREALNRLVGEGLCIRVPYKGVRVIVLSLANLEDIYAIRGLLEGLAAELAASRITPEELAQMRELLPATIVDSDPESVERAREANREFHEITVGASGRRFLIQILRQLWDWIDPMMLYARTLEEDAGAEIRKRWGERDRIQHTRLLEALEAGDGPRARQVVAEYVEEAWHNLVSVLSASADELETPE
ncbi:MAG: GntR family transcriptional regulator [Anaerolineae bacterium]|jgi:DNA-binding GntR family transcriptional regulator